MKRLLTRIFADPLSPQKAATDATIFVLVAWAIIFALAYAASL